MIPYNFGAKGNAEPWTGCGVAAIACAVVNAIGVHIYEIPMTPEKALASTAVTKALQA